MQITHAIGTDASQRLVFVLFIGNSQYGLFHLSIHRLFFPPRPTKKQVFIVFWSISDDFEHRELGGISAQN